MCLYACTLLIDRLQPVNMSDTTGESSAQPVDGDVAVAAVDYSVVDVGSLGETATAGNDDCPHRTGVTVLCGQTLACLHVDNTEHLSLAQISNTLLRRFSYNDIHNRRVALGITCTQCTPAQVSLIYIATLKSFLVGVPVSSQLAVFASGPNCWE